MKDMFRGYYRPTDEEFEALWEDALIVLDANVLLNLYSYSSETQTEFLKLLEELQDRLWLPHQAAAEYHDKRCKVITDEITSYRNFRRDLKKVNDTLTKRKGHPFVDSALFGKFSELCESIEAAVDEGKGKQESLIRDDPIRDQLGSIFDGRTGNPTSDEELAKIYAEGSKRYKQRKPPGYKDADKSEPGMYGDLVIWKQVIGKASRDGKDVIFVTDDSKEDWWLKVDEETIGPRPELLQEFREETSRSLYVYSSDSFVERAKERGKRVSDEAVAELEAAKEARAARDLIRVHDSAARAVARLASATEIVRAATLTEQMRALEQVKPIKISSFTPQIAEGLKLAKAVRFGDPLTAAMMRVAGHDNDEDEELGEAPIEPADEQPEKDEG